MDCWDASVSYAMAVKDCEDQGLREEDYPEAGGSLASLVSCIMKEIDDLGSRIKDLEAGRITPQESYHDQFNY